MVTSRWRWHEVSRPGLESHGRGARCWRIPTPSAIRVRKAAERRGDRRELMRPSPLTRGPDRRHLDVILPGTCVRFLLGGQVHVDRLELQLYRAHSAPTGSGTHVGSVNTPPGQATLTDWRALSSLALTVAGPGDGARGRGDDSGSAGGWAARRCGQTVSSCATTRLGVAISATARTLMGRLENRRR